jgi:cell division protease FtsH
MLDPAVLRGGRFGLQIKVDLPDVEGRADIFKKLIHRLKVKLAPGTDLDDLAKRFAKDTSGLSGADLQHIIADAIIQEGYRGASYVGEKQLFSSIEYREDGGEVGRKLLPEERVMIAYHEAGHALGEHFLTYGQGVRKLTILGHGNGAEAFMRPQDDERRYRFEAWMLDRMTIAMLGRAAEEIFSGRRYNGVAGDFPMARHYANQMVAHLGMSELGPRTHDARNPNDISDATKRENEVAVNRLMSEALERAKKLVEEKRDVAERIVAALLERETIRAHEFIEIAGPKAPQPRVDGPRVGEAFKRLPSAAGTSADDPRSSTN